VQRWARPLEALYPIVYFDALVVKTREDGRTVNKSVYLALGVNMEGQKELLGLWISLNEGAKFWLNVMTELQNRGLKDIFIACVDGLKGFPEAIETVYPDTKVQLCIVHMIRNSVKYVSWKDRKQLIADLKKVYKAYTAEEAETNLVKFSEKWDKKYSTISKIWRRNWERIIPFFEYPEDIRKAIYTTNAIESINHSLRKIIKNRGAFPTDEAIIKILYLALRNVSKRWTMPIKNWKAALNMFALKFEERFPA
jgi:putative transposase